MLILFPGIVHKWAHLSQFAVIVCVCFLRGSDTHRALFAVFAANDLVAANNLIGFKVPANGASNRKPNPTLNFA